MIKFLMTLSSPNSGFKVTVYLQVEYLKKVRLWTKLLKNTNKKPYTIYRMIPLSIILSDLWPRFEGHDIF